MEHLLCRQMAAAIVAAFAVPLSEAEQKELSAMESDLQFLLSEFEVPVSMQLRLVRLGSKSTATFAVMADDRPGMRTAIRADLVDATEANLAPDLASTARSVTTALLAAWMSAEQKVTAQVKASAEGGLLRLPNLMTRPALIALRQRFETEHGRTNDTVWPCASFIERRFEEAEEGTCTAPTLSEVIAQDIAKDDHVVLTEVGVSVKVRKAVKDISLPRTTEEFRTRIKTLAISYVLASYKHGNRLWLRTATMKVFQDYAEHMLSDEVANFAFDRENLSVAADWQTVLEYEHAIRKAACRAILYDGKDFATALLDSSKDEAIRSRYFITPTAILAASRKNNAGAGSKGSGTNRFEPKEEVSNPRKRKAENKKGGKGKGKGNKKGGKGVKTPDGRFVCPFYNGANGCKKDPCNYVHCCNNCMGDHPDASCPSK